MGGFQSTPIIQKIHEHSQRFRAVHPQLANEAGKVANAMDKRSSAAGREKVLQNHQEVNGALVDYFTLHMAEQPESRDWGYLQNGADWCCGGNEQSPINITTSQAILAPTQFLKIWWSKAPITGAIIDNGHTLMLNGAISRCVGVNDLRISELFEAIQLHFHDPSEHKINGKSYPLEMHIVHTLLPDHFDEGVKRNLAVIAIFFEIDDSSPPNDFIDSLCLDKVGTEISIIPQQFLGHIKEPEFYAYKGSLTTPPCPELVNWFVLPTPLQMTTTQHNLFASRWIADAKFSGGHGNNRIIQPLNGREVFKGNCENEMPMHKTFV